MWRIVLVLLAGCGGFVDRQAASTTLRLLDRSQVAAARVGDVELARDALAGGIVQLAAFALAYPDERRFAELHADAVCDYAMAFVFDDWEDASLAGRTDEARASADRLRELLPECIALESARLPPGWTPATLRPADVPAALAIARARAAQLALSPMAGIAGLPALRELLERCAALRPGFHDADAELLLGTLAANLSAFTHGPDGSEWFAKAKALAGEGVLVIDVMRARSVAVARKDKEAFETELAKVLDADRARWPDHRLANALAVRKAKRYLAAEAKLIP